MPRQIIFATFKRPFNKIALGIAVAALIVGILVMTDSENPRAHEIGRVAITVVLITVCCMLACIIPTRRALGIQPTEALKDEG